MNPSESIRRCAVAVVLVIITAWLIVACGGGGGTPAGPPADPSAKATVGAAGGSVASPDGKLVLTIPAGALGNDTEITITEVAAANVPDRLKPLAADRVFKLEPDGLQFAQPVTARIAMPAGSQLAVMVIDGSGKTEYAGAQELEFGTSERSLSGQLTHFSHVVTKTMGGFSLTHEVDKTELRVSERVTSTARLSKTDSKDVGSVVCNAHSSSALALFYETGLCNPDDIREFFSNSPFSLDSVVTWRCRIPGPDYILVVFSFFDLTFDAEADYTDLGRMRMNIKSSIDVVCREPGANTDIVPTGVFLPPHLRFKLDGFAIADRAIANLPSGGVLATIAGSNGAVVVNLVTGAAVLNQTETGADGPLGDNLLDVQPISRASPGPNTAAALFGTTVGGSGSFLRNWDIGFSAWGLTQISPQVAYIDASNAGNSVVADEMVTVAPGAGVHFIRHDAATGFFNFASGTSLARSLFAGTLRSAVLPSAAAGSPVLALSAGTDGATTSTLWAHTRQSAQQPAVKLFAINDADARRLRCLALDALTAALSGKIPCMVTGFASGTAHYFVYDPANPTAAPQVQTLQVGAGALGVQFGVLADGSFAAVVSNFNADVYNVITFNADGSVAINRSIALPAGCRASPHSAVFSHAGKNYVAGTCNATDNYFVAAL